MVAFSGWNQGIHVFDGENWRESKLEGYQHYYVSAPFFDDGRLMVRTNKGEVLFYSAQIQEWKKLPLDEQELPWEVVEFGPLKFPYLNPEKAKVDLADCPIPESDRVRVNKTYDGDVSMVIGSTHQAIVSPNGTWFMIAKDLGQHQQKLSNYDKVDNSGRWLIRGYTRWVDRHIIYQPEEFLVEALENDLGKVSEPGFRVAPKWKSGISVENGEDRWRFRVDEGRWSRWQRADRQLVIPGVVEKGRHQLEVQVMNPEYRFNGSSLIYKIETEYDLKTVVGELIKELDANDFEVRETATGKLSEFGPAVLELMQEVIDSGEASFEFRLRMSKIAEEVNRNWKISDVPVEK